VGACARARRNALGIGAATGDGPAAPAGSSRSGPREPSWEHTGRPAAGASRLRRSAKAPETCLPSGAAGRGGPSEPCAVADRPILRVALLLRHRRLYRHRHRQHCRHCHLHPLRHRRRHQHRHYCCHCRYHRRLRPQPQPRHCPLRAGCFWAHRWKRQGVNRPRWPPLGSLRARGNGAWGACSAAGRGTRWTTQA